MTTIVNLVAVNKTFGRKSQVLNDISFQISSGSVVGLIGKSGSGKSTLIRVIAGFERADPGATVELFGQPVQAQGRIGRGLKALRPRIGVIFQQFNLVGRSTLLRSTLTGRLGRLPRWRGTFGLFRSEDKRRALEALESVGVLDKARQRVSTLSGGQQQRGAIARAIAQEAELLLADEPIASLDPGSSETVMTILRDLAKERGVTVIVSLHQIDHALRFCDRVIALKDGHIVKDAPVADVKRADLEALYGTEALDGAEVLQTDKEFDPARVPDGSGAAAPDTLDGGDREANGHASARMALHSQHQGT